MSNGSVRKLDENEVEKKRQIIMEHLYNSSKLDDKIMEIEQKNPYRLTKEETCIVDAIEIGFARSLALYDLLEADLKNHKLKNGIEALGYQEKVFMNIYSFYAGCLSIILETDKLVKEKVNVDKDFLSPEDFGNFIMEPSSLSAKIISNFYILLDDRIQNDENPVLKMDSDEKFAKFTSGYFKLLKNTLMEESKKSEYKDLVELINGTDIQIDGIIINGFDYNIDGKKDNITMDITWDDIIGNREAKKALKTYAEQLFIYDPEKKKNVMVDLANLPRTTLLFARPGTGKTMLLKSMINHMQKLSQISKKNFEYIILDSSLKDKYVGESVKNLKNSLEKGIDPGKICLIIIEDVDAVFANRNDDSACIAEKDMLSYLMNFVEGIKTQYYGNYMIISTTNHGDEIDKALRDRLGQKQFLVPGPQTIDDYVGIMNLMLKKGIENGYVTLNKYGNDKKDDEQWKTIAETLKEANMSGRDCRNIAISLIDKATSIEIPKEIYELDEKEMEKELSEKFKKVGYTDMLKTIDDYLVTREEQIRVDEEAKIRRIAKSGWEYDMASEYRLNNPKEFPNIGKKIKNDLER